MSKQMKVLGRVFDGLPDKVPFSILSEEWAQKIHRQTLDRLNERGGLCPAEIYWNINKIDSGSYPSDSEITKSINNAINEQLKESK